MVALVTCATSQIGAAVARKLNLESLYVTGRTQSKLESLSDDLKAIPMLLDFFDKQSVDSVITSLPDGIDKLVFIIPRIEATTEIFPNDDEWIQLFDHYFVKPLRLLKGLYQQDKLASGCKLVAISGLSSQYALSHYAMNNCLRLAWLGQMKSMALHMAKDKISVNTLSLGGVMTDTYMAKLVAKADVAGRTFDEQMAIEVSNVPLSQYASVDTVAESVVSILGPMSDHMTGQNLLLDGGFVKAY